MTSQGDLPATLLRAAVRFDVAESDFLLLQHLGFHSLNSLAFKLPKSEDLERFLEDHILGSSAYQQPDGVVVTFRRQPPEQWTTWKLSDDAAALRRLWAFARETAKAEIERMSSGDETRQKITLIEATAMESAALARGCPEAGSDRERPSLYTLNLLRKSLQNPGATYEVLSWEAFISREEEDKLVREGKLPKHSHTELVLGKDSKVVARDRADESTAGLPKVDQMEVLRARLDLRARAIEMIDVARYSTLRSLSDRYYSKLNTSLAEGMRAPTLNELRRFDRELQVTVFRHLSRGQGSLEDAIRYYVENDGDTLWRLLDPVIRLLPDQGVEASSGSRKESGAEKRKAEDSVQHPEVPPDPKKPLVTCLMCKKKHLPLCKLPEDFRLKQRDRKKAKQARKREAKAKAKANAEAKP
eukprot:s2629_g3.t1